MQPDTLTRDEHRAQVVADELGLRREVNSDLFVNEEAIYGANDRYRYLLTRRWQVGGTTCTWIMLNPSTATAFEDDPTIRRCIGYSRAWGHSALHVVNLFAWRATDPHALRHVADPVGPHNDRFIREICHPGWQVVAAWGVHGKIRRRAYDVTRMLAGLGVELSCLERTPNGQPRHPLYMPGDLTLQPYRPAW